MDDELDAGDAVSLLMLSGLDQSVLHTIWDIADPTTEGYLTEQGFYLALRLCGLGQQGKEITADAAKSQAPIVDLKDKTAALMHLVPVKKPASDTALNADLYVISDEERADYNATFAKAGPSNGILSGSRSRKVLTQTGLGIEMLGRIWELADIDEDGALSEYEFAVAMKLIKNMMYNDVEPPESLPDSMKPQPASPPPVVSRKPISPPAASSPDSGKPDDDTWVVSDKEKETYDKFFTTADKDGDGLVSGSDIMKFFLSSQLSKEVLAHVWNLVDIGDTGMINAEQFALAMHFIAKKVKGTEVPDELEPHHIPPSFRDGKKGNLTAQSDVNDEPVVTAPVEDNDVAITSDDDDAEIAALKAANAKLKAELEAQEAEIEQETTEVKNLAEEIKALRAEERRLRKQIKEGRQTLQEILEEKRAKKKEKSRAESKVAKLAENHHKMEFAIEKASRDSTSRSTSGAGWSEPDDDLGLPEGMSPAEFFGQ